MYTTPEVGIDHLTMLDVSPPELVTVAREAGFDAVSPRVLTASPSEESWLMTPGSKRPRAGWTRRASGCSPWRSSDSILARGARTTRALWRRGPSWAPAT